MKEYTQKNKTNTNRNFSILLMAGCVLALGFMVTGQSIYASRETVAKLQPRAMQILEDGLDDADPQIRVKAIEAVAEARIMELMPRVKELMKDDFVPVRFAAALASGDMKYAPAKEYLQILMKDKPDVNTAAAYGLYELGDTSRLEVIRRALQDPDRTVRANAALLIGKAGDQESLPVLHELRNDDDYRVSFLAVGAICQLGDASIYPRLWAMLISAFADDRVVGIEAMGTLGCVASKNPKMKKVENDAKGALTSLLSDEVPEVRLAAARQLGKMGYPIGEPEVGDVFESPLLEDKDERGVERVYVLAASAIGQIQTENLIQYLPKLLKNRSKTVRIAAARAVLMCSDKNAQK